MSDVRYTVCDICGRRLFEKCWERIKREVRREADHG